MPTTEIIEERTGKLQKEDYVYLSVVLIFLLLVLLVFSSVVSFHTANINKVFSVTQAEPIKSLDMEQYTLIARKLNLTLPQEGTDSNATSSQQKPVTPAVTTPKAPPDLSTVTVKVLNSTAISGLAAKLADSLKRDGFIMVVTGNESEALTTTTVSIAENKKEYETAIMKAVRKLYPSAVSQIQESNRGYDIIITIGNN